MACTCATHTHTHTSTTATAAGLKGRTTDADTNILYEIVNYRYMHNKPMIISTEKSPATLVDFDEAVGSRILEMCRGNIVQLQGKELN